MVSKVSLAVLVLSLAYVSEARLFRDLFPGKKLNDFLIEDCKGMATLTGVEEAYNAYSRKWYPDNSNQCAKLCLKKRLNGVRKKKESWTAIVGSVFEEASPYGKCICYSSTNGNHAFNDVTEAKEACLFKPVKPTCVDYQEEPITTDWCTSNSAKMYICDGTRDDCLAKGQALCSADSTCHGVMYNPKWSAFRKGVFLCTSRNLAPKADWQTFLKCPVAEDPAPEWSDWQDGGCSVTCGGAGTRTYSRTCPETGMCDGAATRTEDCNNGAACPCVDYQEEPITTEGCASDSAKMYICDGTRDDCLAKGQAICSADSNCHGIMYNPRWTAFRKGVMLCTTRTLAPKADWQTFLKCPEE